MDTSSIQHENTPIKIFNRLTKENRLVIASLRKLQKEGKILKDGIRYRNCSFEVKVDADSNFVAIPSLDHLNLFFA
jgi:hypothetical protein